MTGSRTVANRVHSPITSFASLTMKDMLSLTLFHCSAPSIPKDLEGVVTFPDEVSLESLSPSLIIRQDGC